MNIPSNTEIRFDNEPTKSSLKCFSKCKPNLAVSLFIVKHNSVSSSAGSGWGSLLQDAKVNAGTV